MLELFAAVINNRITKSDEIAKYLGYVKNYDKESIQPIVTVLFSYCASSCISVSSSSSSSRFIAKRSDILEILKSNFFISSLYSSNGCPLTYTLSISFSKASNCLSKAKGVYKDRWQTSTAASSEYIGSISRRRYRDIQNVWFRQAYAVWKRSKSPFLLPPVFLFWFLGYLINFRFFFRVILSWQLYGNIVCDNIQDANPKFYNIYFCNECHIFLFPIIIYKIQTIILLAVMLCLIVCLTIGGTASAEERMNFRSLRQS